MQILSVSCFVGCGHHLSPRIGGVVVVHDVAHTGGTKQIYLLRKPPADAQDRTPIYRRAFWCRAGGDHFSALDLFSQRERLKVANNAKQGVIVLKNKLVESVPKNMLIQNGHPWHPWHPFLCRENERRETSALCGKLKRFAAGRSMTQELLPVSHHGCVIP